MSASIVKFGTQGKSFRRLDGIVTEKNGLVTVEYKPQGMVKSKTASFPSNSVAAYQTGTPGFVIAPSTDPITQVVGKVSSKNGNLTVSTDAGTVIINQIDGVSISMDEVEADSREARMAERASKVRVKLPRAARAEAGKASSKKAKADKTEKKASAKSDKVKSSAKADKGKSKDKSRTEVVKKKKNRG